jgi:hypothetical protein
MIVSDVLSRIRNVIFFAVQLIPSWSAQHQTLVAMRFYLFWRERSVFQMPCDQLESLDPLVVVVVPEDRVFNLLRRRAISELGALPTDFPGIALIKGDGFDTRALPNGSILYDETLVDISMKVGSAVVASKTGQELLSNIRQVVAGKWVVPAGQRQTLVRKHADAFLAMIMGHELTHAGRYDDARGAPPGEDTSELDRIRGIKPKGHAGILRAKELTADAGGLELAVRAGFFPLGAMAAVLYLSTYPALSGQELHPKNESVKGIHLSWGRFRMGYRVLAKMRQSTREGVKVLPSGKPARPFLSPAQERDLALLFSLQETRAFLQRVAEEAGSR